jgi:hypothetical protein
MSLSKRKAREAAVNSNKSWGELLEMVIACEGARDYSVINKIMLLSRSLRTMLEVISTKDQAEIPNTIRCEKGTLSIDGIAVMNIYRECGY